MYFALDEHTGQAEQLFRLCDVAFSPDDKNQARLPIERITELWHKIVAQTGNDAFGFIVGTDFVHHAMDVFTLAAASSPSLLDAVQRLTQFYQTVSTGLILETSTDDGIGFHFSLPKNAPGICIYAVDASFATIVELTRKVASDYSNPITVSMQRPVPKNEQAFHDFFGCKVAFGQKSNSVIYDGAKARQPSLGHNPALASHLFSYLDESLKEVVDSTLAQQVYVVIDGLFEKADITMGSVASVLAVSERTLQRKLSSENASFNHIHKQFKLDKAIKWLKAGSLSQGEISHRLGFSTQSNFVRFFKTETGFTPNVFVNP